MLYCFIAETLTVAQLGTRKLQICETTNWISEYKCRDLSEWEHHSKTQDTRVSPYFHLEGICLISFSIESVSGILKIMSQIYMPNM